MARRPPTLKLRRVNVLSFEAAEQRRGIAGHDRFLFGPQPDQSGGLSFPNHHSVGSLPVLALFRYFVVRITLRNTSLAFGPAAIIVSPTP